MTLLYFAGLLCAYRPCPLHVAATTTNKGGVRQRSSWQSFCSCTDGCNRRDCNRSWLLLHRVSWLLAPAAFADALVINGRWRPREPHAQAVARDLWKMVSEGQTCPQLIVVLTNSVQLSNFLLFVSLKPFNRQQITVLIIYRCTFSFLALVKTATERGWK